MTTDHRSTYLRYTDVLAELECVRASRIDTMIPPQYKEEAIARIAHASWIVTRNLCSHPMHDNLLKQAALSLGCEVISLLEAVRIKEDEYREKQSNA